MTITHPGARHNPAKAEQEAEADGSLLMVIAANV
jgi:hypothetical protein